MVSKNRRGKKGDTTPTSTILLSVLMMMMMMAYLNHTSTIPAIGVRLSSSNHREGLVVHLHRTHMIGVHVQGTCDLGMFFPQEYLVKLVLKVDWTWGGLENSTKTFGCNWKFKGTWQLESSHGLMWGWCDHKFSDFPNEGWQRSDRSDHLVTTAANCWSCVSHVSAFSSAEHRMMRHRWRRKHVATDPVTTRQQSVVSFPEAKELGRQLLNSTKIQGLVPLDSAVLQFSATYRCTVHTTVRWAGLTTVVCAGKRGTV
jgi:hypothetical protein